MADCDAYVNVAGGMRVVEPALDLALVAALLSSYHNRSLKTACFCLVRSDWLVRCVRYHRRSVV